MPGHQLLVLGNRFPERPGSTAIHAVEPVQRDGAPGIVDGFQLFLCEPHQVIRARIGAHQGKVAGAAGGIERLIILSPAYGHAPGAAALRVLPVRVEIVLLCVLIRAQRDHIQHMRLGDPGDPKARGLEIGQAKVVPQDGVWRAPADASDCRVRIALFASWLVRLPAQIGDDLLHRLAAIEHGLEEPDSTGSLGDRRRPSEGKAHAGGTKVIHDFGKLAQQALAVLGRQTVGYCHHIGLLLARAFQDALGGNRRAQEHGSPASGLSQPQKVQNARHVHALAQRGGDNGLH